MKQLSELTIQEFIAYLQSKGLSVISKTPLDQPEVSYELMIFQQVNKTITLYVAPKNGKEDIKELVDSIFPDKEFALSTSVKKSFSHSMCKACFSFENPADKTAADMLLLQEIFFKSKEAEGSLDTFMESTSLFFSVEVYVFNQPEFVRLLNRSADSFLENQISQANYVHYSAIEAPFYGEILVERFEVSTTFTEERRSFPFFTLKKVFVQKTNAYVVVIETKTRNYRIIQIDPDIDRNLQFGDEWKISNKGFEFKPDYW